jgi:ABC-type glycerol-3-phosphate transport system substrate-binding protein
VTGGVSQRLERTRRAGLAGWGWALATVVLLSLVWVVGCGAKGAELPTVSFLTMEYTARSATDWKDLEKQFNESHDKFQVAVTVADWGSAHLKLANLLKDGKPPDIATVPAGWLLEYYRNGKLSRLDDLAGEAFLKRFHPAALKTGVVVGHRYGLPFGLSVRFLYINSKMLSACGLLDAKGAPLLPGNWDQLAQVAQAMQAAPDAVREQNGLPAEGYGLGLPMSLEEAIAIKNRLGKPYIEISTEDLKNMAIGLSKVSKPTPDQEKKILAIQIILKDRTANPAQPAE